MASRTSGRGEERSGGRAASSGNDNSTARRQGTPSQGAASSARQNAGGSSSQSGGGQRQSATQSQNANQEANRTQSQSPELQGQQTRASSGVNDAERGDRERDLHTSREQGNMRPAASSQRGNAGRETASYGASRSGGGEGGGANPFALMRRMMEDMDRIFSDFGFTTPGMFGSGLLNSGMSPSSTQQSQTGGSVRGSSLAETQRGQQGLTRGGQGGLQQRSFGSLWAPQVEVFERGNNLVVRADLPGLSREDVDVELDEDALIIRGQRQSDVEDEDEGFYRSERSYGSFYRAIPLPEGIEASGCNATFKNGVLEVTLPKPQQQPSKARRIDVRGA